MVDKNEVDKFVWMMIKVLSDPMTQDIYIKDPKYVMKQWDISEEIQNLIISGESKKIHDMFVAAGFPVEARVIIKGWP